jgi:hypothetical protein
MNVLEFVEVVDVEPSTTFSLMEQLCIDEQPHDFISHPFTLAPLTPCHNTN